MFTFRWSAESPCRWKRLEMYLITPVCSCHSNSLREEHLHVPKVLLELWLVWIYLAYRFFFFFLTTSIAFKYIRLVGLMYSTLYMLMIPVTTRVITLQSTERELENSGKQEDLKQCRSCCKDVLEWDWKCDACWMCVLVIEVLIAGVSEASWFPFRHLQTDVKWPPKKAHNRCEGLALMRDYCRPDNILFLLIYTRSQLCLLQF